MKLPLYQVDAFAEKIFEGNPAAVCPLKEWLPERLMQQIALENNLSETAFFVEKEAGFELRWFTPSTEVDLCGHATLACAHVLFRHLGFRGDELEFQTKSGMLSVKRAGSLLVMDFPAVPPVPAEAPGILHKALGITPAEVYKSDDYMLVVDSAGEVAGIQPDFALLAEVEARGIIVTAPGNDCDFVSRFFGPRVGVNEDPVTGSAHTKLIPYWSRRLGKTTMTARQVSKRGGKVFCRAAGSRAEISGHAVTYLTGEIEIRSSDG